MIEIKDLVKDYVVGNKQTLRAIKNINLTFSDNEFTSILGQSGCGKTTLLNLIGGLDLPTSGDIIFNSLSIPKMKANQIDAYRNNQIGFILQNYYLIPSFNVLDNVKMAVSFGNLSKNEIDKKAREVLEKVGMKDYIKSLPKQLSGGQQQRVAIARALVNNPSIILADEPTGSLDNSTAKEIMDLLKELSKDKLVIMVTHNEEIAKKYSTRIIRMHDGQIASDKVLSSNKEKVNEKPNEKVNLSFFTRVKLAIKSIFSKKLKTIMTVIATSFGMVGISFFLGLNHGFNQYANKFSSSIATSTPIVVTPYTSESATISSSEFNNTVEYSNDDTSIYPSVSSKRETAFKYNNFSQKYFNYLNKMIDDKLIREYYEHYYTSYSLNLITRRPESLDGTRKSFYGTVLNDNRNILHNLYGELDDYDVIAGKKLDTLEDTDLVLVVNKYNSISFSYLKSLGFYATSDKEDDVKDPDLKSKVKPISFETVLQKEYKAFTNDEFYTKVNTTQTVDDLGVTRNISTYKVTTLGNEGSKYDDLFNSDKGIKLKVASIIRPKKISGLTALTPSLCYRNTLFEKFTQRNDNLPIAKNLSDNIVFDYHGDDEEVLNNPNKGEAFINKVKELTDSFFKGESLSKVFPRQDLNKLLEDFFRYYSFNYSGNHSFSDIANSGLDGFTSFLSHSIALGASIVDDSLLGKDLSDEKTFNEQLEIIRNDIYNPDKLYKDIISIVGYINAYSLVEEIVIYPSGINQRKEILNRLDSFNEIQVGSEDHAADLSEVVTYAPENDDYRVEQVGVVMSIVYEILGIFVAICLIVASSMIAVITSGNVIERIKEIGLLRSLGSKKKDIAFLFELEAFITGFISGLLSSVITFVLQIPLNYSISKNYPGFQLETICNFTWYHMLIVLAISVTVGLVAAIIPSLKAANKNPAECLHAE